MAQLLYACRFEVHDKAGITTVSNAYRDWVVNHYREGHKITEFNFDPKTSQAENLPEHHRLESRLYESDAGNVISLSWRYPRQNDDNLQWLNNIRIGQFEDDCSVEHLIHVEFLDYVVTPERPAIGSPRVVRDICMQTSVFVNDRWVHAALHLLGWHDLDDLLVLLASSRRQLPVVLLSPYDSVNKNHIDAKKLAENLAGVAIVCCFDEPRVTWNFSDKVGQQLSCFNGAARIYWPGFSKEDYPKKHRLFFGDWIKQVGGTAAMKAIERAVFSVAAYGFVPDQRITKVIQEAEAAERRKRLEEIKEKNTNEFLDEYESDLRKLNEYEKKIQELENENANLRANQQVILSNPINEFLTDKEIPISSVAEAVERAAELYSDTIEILPSAVEAANDSPYQRPGEVFEALRDINEITGELQGQQNTGASIGSVIKNLKKRNLPAKRRISPTTKGKYGERYKFLYKGSRRLFEPHITLGKSNASNCLSIHFIFNEEKCIIESVSLDMSGNTCQIQKRKPGMACHVPSLF